MEPIKAPRGVHDVLPEEHRKWSYVFRVAEEVAFLYGYGEVSLPIFEHTELFSRGIGEATDIVEKEMYTFQDKSGRSLTLRPEATASMVRSYLENGMRNRPQPVKLWCKGPMFRHERPQKGRYRQFWQLDFEALGSPDPLLDVEVIGLSVDLFARLGLKNLAVVVNSVGCPVCRPSYREALRAFLKPRLDGLCPSCQSRYERNVLRVLDCKEARCKELTEEAPSSLEFLCGSCKSHHEVVVRGLKALGLEARLDKRLVRGLDYYTKTAFEVLSGELGAQNAVCGGGRYDHLAEAIGGPHVPGVGFAAGVERVVMLMEGQGCSFGEERSLEVFVACVAPEDRLEGALALSRLRALGVSADMDYLGRSLKGQLKAADSLGVRFALIVGGDELKGGLFSLKDMRSGEQEVLRWEEVLSRIRPR